MEVALGACTVPSLRILKTKTQFSGPIFTSLSSLRPNSRIPLIFKPSPRKSVLFTAGVSSSPTVLPTEPETKTDSGSEKFDWYANWYPVMPVCDLDKRAPHGKRVVGLDLVVWWDRNENQWKVMDDTCPHRLAPLSDGRIDQRGRLQCVYHGWCFSGSGDCKFIPQAPPDGPPVHTFKQACVAVYPSTVQHDIIWFWPNTDPQYKNIIEKTKPPYIPELEDPSITKLIASRDIPFGYDILIENLMDAAHVPYAHYGLMHAPGPKVKADREGGTPLEINVKTIDKNGYSALQNWGFSNFIAPCVYRASTDPLPEKRSESLAPDAYEKTAPPKHSLSLIFLCVPVSPGRSRIIWTINSGLDFDKIVPRWVFHITQNKILDSDLNILHVQERKILERGPENWQRECFVPTKSDALVVAFRRWFNKYGGSEVDWRGRFDPSLLPPTPPREQLFDRYWSHVVNCRSCNTAYKRLNALEVILQIFSVASVGIAAASKRTAARTGLVLAAVLCYAASKWLSHFIYKTFRYHDYNHALV
ncbi:PREDICTED: protochlorophyllide-dependent translocon component 52, chloroplastic-like isoform X2 [Tarenaya hassleriana]|uniref:protochlorophyllide-dependent translocon component 52, chloroplastic-like isoform X2 n=1 Tax=Tarenaya hassleriana TaxID=28532 RepID=UPI00053C7156|nr:PREDICTED: protochlorophyllide-dependent translocon component 52, chloroplastic-like isoform X2 [Tarenaya hassleriana]